MAAYYVPVIELDSVINPYDATGRHGLPGGRRRDETVSAARRINDGGLLMNYAMDLVRFVKPQKMSVTQDFNMASS